MITKSGAVPRVLGSTGGRGEVGDAKHAADRG